MDPIWLDTCTISRIGNGDVMLEVELLTLRNNGYQLLYTPSVERELFFGNPYRGKPSPPELFFRKQMAINRLGAKLDNSVDFGRAVELVAAHSTDVPGYMRKGDLQNLSEVASSAENREIDTPILFSTDHDMFKYSERIGVETWVRSSLPVVPPELYASHPEPPSMRQLGEMPVYSASNAAEFVGAIGALNAMQVKVLTELAMQDAAAEAWADWKSNRRHLRDELKQFPGKGYAVSFWFEIDQGFDMYTADMWTYVQMRTNVQSKAGTVPMGSMLAMPSSSVRTYYQHIDLWIPAVLPAPGPKLPKPVAKTGPSGPGLNSSPQMDFVETDVYMDLDPNTPKPVEQIASDTGYPIGDVGVALAKLQKKNFAAFWQKGESFGWVRLQ